jgi:septation ring formation regulator EzrA
MPKASKLGPGYTKRLAAIKVSLDRFEDLVSSGNPIEAYGHLEAINRHLIILGKWLVQNNA